MDGKKKKVKGGRFPEKAKRSVEVADLIPEDGTCIRFNELKNECTKHGISHRILLKDLKRLQEAGTIIKEAVKAERGAGTCYKRILIDLPFYNTSFPNTTLKAFSVQLKDLEIRLDAIQNKSIKDVDEEKKIATKDFYNLYINIYMTILSELGQYAVNPNRQEAEMHVDSVLKDFIVPMIKKTVTISCHPVMRDEQIKFALFKAPFLGSENWNSVWEMPKFKEVGEHSIQFRRME